MTPIKGVNLDTFLVGMIFLSGLMKKERGVPLFRFTAVNFLIVLLFFVAVLSLSKSYVEIDITVFLEELKRWFTQILLFFFAANFVSSKKGVQFILKTILISILCCLAVSLVGIFVYSGIEDRLRIGLGNLQQPNQFTAFLVIYGPLFFLLMTSQKQLFIRLILGGGFLLSVYVLLFTGSRGGWLCFAIVLLLVGVLRSRLLLVALIFGLTNFAVVAPQSVVNRIESTFNPINQSDEYDGSTEMRLLILRSAPEVFTDSPIFGHGYGVSGRLLHRYGFLERGRATHNFHLKMLLELGLVGFAIYIAIQGALLWKCVRFFRRTSDELSRDISLWGVCALVSVFLVNFFGGHFDQQNIMTFFWILMGLIFTLDKIQENEDKSLYSNKLTEVVT